MYLWAHGAKLPRYATTTEFCWWMCSSGQGMGWIRITVGQGRAGQGKVASVSTTSQTPILGVSHLQQIPCRLYQQKNWHGLKEFHQGPEGGWKGKAFHFLQSAWCLHWMQQMLCQPHYIHCAIAGHLITLRARYLITSVHWAMIHYVIM